MEKLKVLEQVFPVDRFMIRLFPESDVYPDGVVCDLALLKNKTMELIRKVFSVNAVDCYFNLNSLEYWNEDKVINVIDYEELHD